jgi:hypothetical protein
MIRLIENNFYIDQAVTLDIENASENNLLTK